MKIEVRRKVALCTMIPLGAFYSDSNNECYCVGKIFLSIAPKIAKRFRLIIIEKLRINQTKAPTKNEIKNLS